MPTIPPWLTQSANPADYTGRGMQIGAQMAAARAAQQFQAQAEARRQQEDAIRDAQWQAEFQLQQQQQAEKAQAAAAKLDAMKKYQLAIQSGADPVAAMLEFGPAMGQQATPEAAALRSMQMQQKPIPSWTPQTTPTGTPYMLSSTGGLSWEPRQARAPQPRGQWLTVSKTDPQGNQYDILQNTLTGDQKRAPTAPVLPAYERPGYLSPAENAELKDDMAQVARMQKDFGVFMDGQAKPGPTMAKALPGLLHKRNQLRQRIEELIRKGQAAENPAFKVLDIRQAQPAPGGEATNEEDAAPPAEE